MKAQRLAKQSDEMVQGQWQVTIDLLRIVQSDYQQARKQLEGICSTFSERENMAGKQLQFVFESATQTKSRYSQDEAMCLRAYCLCGFEVYVGYRQVEHWCSLKAKSLLKYLIAQHGRPVPKDVLMETLWAGWSPELANSNLRAAMHALRQSLGDFSNEGNGFPYILFCEGNYLINPQVVLWVDDEEFERHYIAGWHLDKEGKSEEAVKEYMLAETLYRGDYLEDDLYEEWTLRRREALNDTYLTILGKLAKHSAQVADYESCITYCQKILAKDPCCEDGYRWLMCSYNRLGRRNRALHWYELCKKTVKKELDVPPERQTVALYHKLLKAEYI